MPSQDDLVKSITDLPDGTTVTVTQPADAHDWICISSGSYDSMYRCAKCKQTHIESADRPGSEPPTRGCVVEIIAVSEATREVRPGDWLASLSSAERKEVAVERGLLAYFPDALALIARHSVRGNEKHNPGQPVHWSRGKSNDHGDCIGRHHLAISVDRNSLDDGQPHIVCRAWRALADLQLWAEEQHRLGRKV